MAAATPPAGLVYACLTHVPLRVDYPAWVTRIHLGQDQAEGRLNLRELAPEWEVHHPVLGGLAGSFALKNLVLRQRPDATSIGLCQYRKFVARQPLSRVRAAGYKSMAVVPLSALDSATLASALDPGGREFLVAMPIRVSRHGMLEQYGRTHCSEDLLRFTAEAVAQGVLEQREAAHFLAEQMLVPGGIELGVYPAAFWLQGIAAIEAVVRACLERYPQPRDGYQARAFAFCAERLGSHLLLRHFGAVGSRGWQRLAWHRPSHWSRRQAGRIHLVTEDGQARYIVGT